MGLVGVQREAVCVYPSTQTSERGFRFLSTATQHHSIVGVSHHYQPGFAHFYVQFVKVSVREQRANNCPLWTTSDRRPPRQIFHDILLEKTLNERHHMTVPDTVSNFREKGIMWNSIKVALQIRVHYPEVARLQMSVYFTQRILAA